MSFLKSLAFASFLFLSAAPAWSQVTYTDIEPDIRLEGWEAHELKLGNATSGGLIIWKHPNEVVINSMTTTVQVLFDGQNPARLEYGQPINSIGMWTQPKYAVLNHEGATGNWIGVEDGYLGIRYKEEGEWHYAWARLDIDQAPTHFTLKDFAFENTADAAILAGSDASTSGVESEQLAQMYTLRGHQLQLHENAHVSISSTIGEQLYEGNVKASGSIDLGQFCGRQCFIRIDIQGKSTSLRVRVGE